MQTTSAQPFADLLRAVDTLLNAPAEDRAGRAHTDLVSDLVGYLGQRMTELHEQRQAEVRQFLAWLEGELGAPIDALAGRTLIEQYWTQARGVDALLDTIERNRPRVTALDVRAPRRYGARNAARDVVTEAYETSMRRLRPVLVQLDITDRLIDRLVYRLYAMTPEEIALVDRHFEGGSSPAEDAHVS